MVLLRRFMPRMTGIENRENAKIASEAVSISDLKSSLQDYF